MRIRPIRHVLSCRAIPCCQLLRCVKHAEWQFIPILRDRNPECLIAYFRINPSFSEAPHRHHPDSRQPTLSLVTSKTSSSLRRKRRLRKTSLYSDPPYALRCLFRNAGRVRAVFDTSLQYPPITFAHCPSTYPQRFSRFCGFANSDKCEVRLCSNIAIFGFFLLGYDGVKLKADA